MHVNLIFQKLEILAKSTGKGRKVIEQDINRPLYLAPVDAVDYGLIDKVKRLLPFNATSYGIARF